MAFLTKGVLAPDFEITDQDGKTVRLSDYRGKKVVLYFYPTDGTPTCTTEACNLRDNYSALQKAGYEVLGVSSDTEKSHRKFIAKEQLPFTLLADTERKLHHAYGTWIEKRLYGRTYMGTARVTYLIDGNGLIEDVIEKVRSKIHASQILGEITVAPAKAHPKAKKAKPLTPTKKIAKKLSKKTSKEK
jgi:peroxiredoxin Q/BCP